MIEAMELSFGNIVLFDESVDIIESLGKTMAFGLKHSHWYYDRLHAIPLTPELLQKAGFIRDGNNWSHHNLDLQVEATAWMVEIILVPNPKYCKEIRYVHQLQNLYFALTGEELEITL